MTHKKERRIRTRSYGHQAFGSGYPRVRIVCVTINEIFILRHMLLF